MDKDLNAPFGPLPADPFVGLDLSRLPEPARTCLAEAAEDFAAVLAGRPPPHARRDLDAPLAADGGSQPFRGRGYALTVLRQLSQFGGASGLLYGPVLVFEQALAPGNGRQIACIRFYTPERLAALLASAAAAPA